MSTLGAYSCIDSSTPCGSGSPLRNFNPDSVTEKDQEWDEIINAIGGYFEHADSCSFELPERNTIWSRPETVNLLQSFDMRHEALVRLCKTGCQGWYSDWKDIEVCFQFSLVCTKSSLQTFNMHMSDSCRTLSNQLY